MNPTVNNSPEESHNVGAETAGVKVPDVRAKLKASVRTGAKKGWDSFFWMCKIIVPISLVVALLQWSGWLSRADFILNPLMRLINLPSEAALPIISGMLINIYAAIAVMAVIPFSIGQMTLVAVFVLIAHNLITEGVIQFRSGINIVEITLVRIFIAIVTVLIISQFFSDTTASIVLPANLSFQNPLAGVLGVWAIDMLKLLFKIFLIVMAIMIVLESLHALGWTEYLFNFFKPLMKVLGLSERAVMPWVTAVFFGLMYGGAVIHEEIAQGDLKKRELEYLHISIGINHSMVEDPALFLALGLNGFWLWVPKLIMAIIVVQILRVIRFLGNKVGIARFKR
jgi:hypothetical protein